MTDKGEDLEYSYRESLFFHHACPNHHGEEAGQLLSGFLNANRRRRNMARGHKGKFLFKRLEKCRKSQKC